MLSQKVQFGLIGNSLAETWPSDWPTVLAWACSRGWGSVEEGSGRVELEASAPGEASSARARKSTELQVMARLPGSSSGLAGDLGQVVPPLPHLPQVSGRLSAGKILDHAGRGTHMNHSSYCSSGMWAGRVDRRDAVGSP